MSNLKTNTTSLQEILDKVNALPAAGESDDFVGVKYSNYGLANNRYYLPKTADARSLDKVLLDPDEAYEAGRLQAENDKCLEYRFYNYTGNANGAYFYLLEDVYIPSKATIFSYTFQNCVNLKNIYGDLSNIMAIGGNAFYRCSSLTQIPYMPNLTSISNNAFRDCTGLTTFNFYTTATSIHTGAFTGCTNLKDIYVPWAEGAVANAPWGATNATIHYNTTYDENHNPIV